MTIETLIAYWQRVATNYDQESPYLEIVNQTIAALRQQQEQGELMAFKVISKHGKPTGEIAIPLFTSPPAPDPMDKFNVVKLSQKYDPPAPAQSRELSDEEINKIFYQYFDGIEFTDQDLLFARAVLAADRAIRPAAGMVSDERSERVIEAAEKLAEGVRHGKSLRVLLNEFDEAKQ